MRSKFVLFLAKQQSILCSNKSRGNSHFNLKGLFLYKPHLIINRIAFTNIMKISIYCNLTISLLVSNCYIKLFSYRARTNYDYKPSLSLFFFNHLQVGQSLFFFFFGKNKLDNLDIVKNLYIYGAYCKENESSWKHDKP